MKTRKETKSDVLKMMEGLNKKDKVKLRKSIEKMSDDVQRINADIKFMPKVKKKGYKKWMDRRKEIFDQLTNVLIEIHKSFDEKDKKNNRSVITKGLKPRTRRGDKQ